jgi:hypothetical protein
MRPRRHSERKIWSGARSRACLSWTLRHTVEKTRFIGLAKGKAMRLGAAITLSCIAFAASAAPALAQGATPCSNPNALGLARTVEVDTTGGPGFGFEQYKAHDFLVLKEVVLTFDDGPLPPKTNKVLDILGDLSLFGLINAVTRTASDVESYDRSVELQRIGGKIIELPKSVWN